MVTMSSSKTDVIVRPAWGASEDIADEPSPEPVTPAFGRLVGEVRVHHRHAHVIENRILHRDFDLLPLTRIYGPHELHCR